MGKRQKERNKMSNQNTGGTPAAQPAVETAAEIAESAEAQTATETQVAEETTDTETTAEAPAAPVVQEEPAPVAAPTPDVQAEAAKAVLDSTMVDPKIAVPMQAMEQTFQSYVENMKRGRPVGEVEGVRNQIALWTLIKSVLGREGQEFYTMFAKLLSLMLDQRDGGVLDPRLRYRFFGGLPLGQVDARNFESILQALLTLANPQERKLALKQVDLSRVFDKYPDKAAAQRVLEFFGV